MSFIFSPIWVLGSAWLRY